MSAFHTSHFGSSASNHFTTTFLQPETSSPDKADVGEDEEEDDGLGYYADGVKRTLTDEQIALFRHSEIQALLRDKRHAAEARSPNPSCSASTSAPDSASYDDYEEGGQVEDGEKQAKSRHRNRKKKNHRKREVKPDLRKRTWDMVDEGVPTLSYEDADSKASTGRSEGPQRKRVSYEDI